MQKIIHKIRQQPQQVREHILHVTTLIAVILVLLWVYSLGTNISNPDTQAGVGQDLQTFSSIKNNMVNGYGNTSQPQQDLQTQENNL